MNKKQISAGIVFFVLFVLLSVCALRLSGWYAVFFTIAVQIAVFMICGNRNLVSFSLSFVPALLLVFHLAGKGPIFLYLSIVAALALVILFRVFKPQPRVRTQWWVYSLLMVEILVFAGLLALA